MLRALLWDKEMAFFCICCIVMALSWVFSRLRSEEMLHFIISYVSSLGWYRKMITGKCSLFRNCVSCRKHLITAGFIVCHCLLGQFPCLEVETKHHSPTEGPVIQQWWWVVCKAGFKSQMSFSFKNCIFIKINE